MQSDNQELLKLIKEISKGTGDIRIPNDPDLTGTAETSPKIVLKKEEQVRLTTFILLLKKSKKVVEPLLPHCFIEGVYEYQNCYFRVWDEWDDTLELDAIFVCSISKEEAKGALLEKINTLMDLLGKSSNLEKKKIELSKEISREEITSFIKNRISMTTLSKVSGWGAGARLTTIQKSVDEFIEKNNRLPSKDEVLLMHGMQHPQLNSKINEIKMILKSLKGEMEFPISPDYGVSHNKQELLAFEAIETLCNASEKFATPAIFDTNGDGIYKIENEFYLRQTLDCAPVEKKQNRYYHGIKKITKNEASRLKNEWKAEQVAFEKFATIQRASHEKALIAAQTILSDF